MLWLLVIHISALLFWCAALLYLPTLIAAGASAQLHDLGSQTEGEDAVARYVYTRIASPAAVVAVAAGTLIFLPDYPVDVWLVLKLTLVTLLVVCHVFVGLLAMRAEENRPVQPWCRILLLVMVVLMLSIIVLVLSKPSPEELLWWL
jgi:protoporphyrinogen IX oxidase